LILHRRFGGAECDGDQYGPMLQLNFPSYNLGSTHMSSFYIVGYVLPTGDFLFGSIQLGGVFS
jgi:hypothetical protein